jgi:hypothetical protein
MLVYRSKTLRTARKGECMQEKGGSTVVEKLKASRSEIESF